MHELAITEDMLSLVLSEARKHDAQKVNRVQLRIGEMTGIVGDSVRFYFEQISKDTIAEGAILSFDFVPAAARCRDCGHQFDIADFVWSCPKCHSLNIDIVAGNELYLESLEVT
jgi:hydrogenase nickel incorporation protein HypA/HybF